MAYLPLPNVISICDIHISYPLLRLVSNQIYSRTDPTSACSASTSQITWEAIATQAVSDEWCHWFGAFITSCWQSVQMLWMRLDVWNINGMASKITSSKISNCKQWVWLCSVYMLNPEGNPEGKPSKLTGIPRCRGGSIWSWSCHDVGQCNDTLEGYQSEALHRGKKHWSYMAPHHHHKITNEVYHWWDSHIVNNKGQDTTKWTTL